MLLFLPLLFALVKYFLHGDRDRINRSLGFYPCKLFPVLTTLVPFYNRNFYNLLLKLFVNKLLTIIGHFSFHLFWSKIVNYLLAIIGQFSLEFLPAVIGPFHSRWLLMVIIQDD